MRIYVTIRSRIVPKRNIFKQMYKLLEQYQKYTLQFQQKPPYLSIGHYDFETEFRINEKYLPFIIINFTHSYIIFTIQHLDWF